MTAREIHEAHVADSFRIGELHASKRESFIAACAESLRPLRDGNKVAIYLGTQEGFHGSAPFDMFNLTRQVGIHPEGSTVGVETLARHGYSAPSIPKKTT